MASAFLCPKPHRLLQRLARPQLPAQVSHYRPGVGETRCPSHPQGQRSRSRDPPARSGQGSGGPGSPHKPPACAAAACASPPAPLLPASRRPARPPAASPPRRGRAHPPCRRPGQAPLRRPRPCSPRGAGLWRAPPSRRARPAPLRAALPGTAQLRPAAGGASAAPPARPLCGGGGALWPRGRGLHGAGASAAAPLRDPGRLGCGGRRWELTNQSISAAGRCPRRPASQLLCAAHPKNRTVCLGTLPPLRLGVGTLPCGACSVASHPLGAEPFPDIRRKPPLPHLHAILPAPVTACQGDQCLPLRWPS